jgi:hypothetical protein
LSLETQSRDTPKSSKIKNQPISIMHFEYSTLMPCHAVASTYFGIAPQYTLDLKIPIYTWCNPKVPEI